MRIKADTDLCVGSGQCVLTKPTVVDQDDDGIVTLSTGHPDGDAAERAQRRESVPLGSSIRRRGIVLTAASESETQ